MLSTKNVFAYDCEFTRNDIGDLVPAPGHECPEGYIETPSGTSSMYTVPDCICVAEEEGVNCTEEGGVPNSSTPCCSGLVPFQYPYGTMCIDENVDPYHNCITTGMPQSGQTCCAGSSLDLNSGMCVLGSSGGTTNLCDNGTGINTAIGCIHVLGNKNAFLSDLLRWATGIGGGIAFALMLYAGFMIMTAQGSPERLKAGQELLTSAIAGLILLVLSVVILKFIGVDILGLDKFGFNQ